MLILYLLGAALLVLVGIGVVGLVHMRTGDPGDIYAYVESSRQLDRVLEEMDSVDRPE